MALIIKEANTTHQPQPPSGGVGGGTASKALRNSSSSSDTVTVRTRAGILKQSESTQAY